MKVTLKDRSRWFPGKRLLFTSNYYDYEMCCFKREMSAPKRVIDSKVWCLLSFLLEIPGESKKYTRLMSHKKVIIVSILRI